MSALGALSNTVAAFTRPRPVSANWAKVSTFQSLTDAEGAELLRRCQLPNSPAVQVQPDLMHLAFEVGDLNAFAARLERKGYKISDGPTLTNSGATIAFIDAPEGYEIELIQPPR